ncbi:MAG: hypothetical protein ACETVX_00535 [bacterium]
MRKLIIFFLIFAVLILSAGCKRIMIPPAFDLKPHELIGIIEFDCENEGQLAGFTTQKFMEWITKDQKGIAIVELGNEEDVLAEVQKERMGPEVYKLLGENYNIKSIFIGEIKISDVRPRIAIGPGFEFASAKAEVEATMTVKLLNVENGATIWLGSSKGKSDVGHVGFFGGHFVFDAKDPESAYGGLAESLIKKATKDFRNTHKCKFW